MNIQENIILYFITGNLLIFLLLFSVYMFPKNLLDKAHLFKLNAPQKNTGKGGGAAKETNAVKKIKFYFYAFDVILYSTIVFSWISMVIGISLFIRSDFMLKIVLIILALSYLMWTVWLWFRTAECRKEDWGIKYLIILNVLSVSFLIVAIYLVQFQCLLQRSNTVIYSLSVIMMSHLFFWLWPHIEYRPISALLGNEEEVLEKKEGNTAKKEKNVSDKKGDKK